MSLVVWMPLNGDVNNQGVGKLNYISGTPVYANDGKLGKCLDLSVNPTLSFSCDELNGLDGSNITIAFWVNVLTGDTSLGDWRRILFLGDANASGTSGSGFRFEACFNSSLRACSTHNNTTNNIWGASHVIIPNDMKNQWHHVCVTMDGSSIKSYRDGVLVAESTSGKGAGHFNGIIQFGHGGAMRGKLNDFRIYDRALSLQEIKTLSQCLLLHYPMTGGCRGCDNLLKYTAVNTANQTLLGNSINGAWKNLPLTTIDGFQCYNYPKSYSPTGFYSGQWLTGMLANTTYTYSAWLYFTSDIAFNFSSLGHFQVYNGNSSASDKSHEDIVSARIYEPSSIKANTWTKVRITFTTNNLAGSYFTVYPRYNVAANVDELYFRDCKLELGDRPTPWMPNSIDNEYSSMGYNNGLEYDVSGYLHNGTINGSVSYSSDTARYSVSTNFSGSNNCWLKNFSLGNEWSYGIWFKYPSGSRNWENIIMLNNNGSDTDTQLSFWINTGSSKLQSTANTQYNSNITLPSVNVWHHFFATFDGSSLKTYIDGNLVDTKSITAGLLARSNFSIGGRFNGTSSWTNYFTGQLSDFRLYATCLTAEDIQKLYNTSASIANNGVLMSYEFAET